MSIWTKPIAEITYDDIDAFCQAQIPEGVKLDYKRELPDNDKIADLIAAYANTFGGLIIYGVNADQTTNKPILPIEGFAPKKGIAEKLEAICLDSIYPPVRPEIQVVQTSAVPPKMFAVVRVSPSPHAPHATQNHTRISIREGSQKRSDELTKPATLERIEAILDRRRRMDDARDAELELMIERARNSISPTDPAKLPILWMTAAPLFSNASSLTLNECLDLHAEKLLIGFPVQNLMPAPRGSFLIGHQGDIELATREGRPQEHARGIPVPSLCSSVTTSGRAFVAKLLLSVRDRPIACDDWIEIIDPLFIATAELAQRMEATASRWWTLSIGAENVRGYRFTYGEIPGHRCIDQKVSVSRMVAIDSIINLVNRTSGRRNFELRNLQIMRQFLHSIGVGGLAD